MPQPADVIAVNQLATKTRGSPTGPTPDAVDFSVGHWCVRLHIVWRRLLIGPAHGRNYCCPERITDKICFKKWGAGHNCWALMGKVQQTDGKTIYNNDKLIVLLFEAVTRCRYSPGWTICRWRTTGCVIKVLSARKVIGVRRSNISNVFLVDKQTKHKEIVFIFR